MIGIKAGRHMRDCKRENHLVLDEAAALESLTVKATKKKINNDSRASTRLLRYREGPACGHPQQKVEYPEEFTKFKARKKLNKRGREQQKDAMKTEQKGGIANTIPDKHGGNFNSGERAQVAENDPCRKNPKERR
jgi:hypothetical protein